MRKQIGYEDSIVFTFDEFNNRREKYIPNYFGMVFNDISKYYNIVQKLPNYKNILVVADRFEIQYEIIQPNNSP